MSYAEQDEFFYTPEGMTEEEVWETIEKVVSKIAPKYTCFGHDVDDIRQESYFICRGALRKYTGEAPLENFLSVVLPRRLINFMRKNYEFKDLEDDKKKVYRPAQLDDEFNTEADEGGDYDRVDYSDMIAVINRELPSDMRMDYLKMAHDVPVSKAREREVTTAVKSILEDYGYYEVEE